MRAAAILVAALAAAVLPATPALAAAGSEFTWSVQPAGPFGPDGRSQFDLSAQPGDVLHEYVAITNLSTAPLTFNVYSTDALNTADGGFTLLPASERPSGPGLWTRIGDAGAAGVQSYVVPAGQRIVIPFTVEIPGNATPGDHAGGIVASVAAQADDANGQAVLVDRRVASRIYLALGGATAPSLAVEDLRVVHTPSVNPFGGGTITVSYLLRNTGNVRLGATSAVAVSGPLGWRLAASDAVAVADLLPGNAVAVTETISGLPAPLWMNVEATISAVDARVPVTTATATVAAAPWLLVAVLGALVAVIVVLMIRRRRSRVVARSGATDDERASSDPAARP